MKKTVVDDETAEIQLTLKNFECLTPEDALISLREYAEIKPYSSEVWTILAQAELQADHHDLARSAFINAYETNNENAVALEFLGNLEYKEQNFAEAARFFRQLCEVRRNDYDSCLKLADAWVRAKNLLNAEEVYRKATSIKGSDIESYKLHAKTLIELKRFESAAEVYRKAQKTFKVDLSAELQPVEEIISRKEAESDSAKNAQSLILEDPHRLTDPSKLISAEEFELSVSAVPWLSKVGKAKSLGKKLKWSDPVSGKIVNVDVAHVDQSTLPNSEDPDLVCGARIGEFADKLRHIEEYNATLTDVRTRLEEKIFPAVETASQKLYSKFSKLEEDADDDDEYEDERLSEALSIVKYDALETASAIATMLKHRLPVPPDFAIRWYFFAKGYWPCEVELQRERPEEYSYDGDLVRDLTIAGDQDLWKDLVYLVW